MNNSLFNLLTLAPFSMSREVQYKYEYQFAPNSNYISNNDTIITEQLRFPANLVHYTGIGPVIIKSKPDFDIVNTYVTDEELREFRNINFKENNNYFLIRKCFENIEKKNLEFKICCNEKKEGITPELQPLAKKIEKYIQRIYYQSEKDEIRSFLKCVNSKEVGKTLMKIMNVLQFDHKLQTERIEFASLMSHILHSTSGFEKLEQDSEETYKARGIIQIKGKENYKLATKLLKEYINKQDSEMEHIDFEKLPEELGTLSAEAITASLLVYMEMINNHKEAKKDLIPGFSTPTLTLTGSINAMGASDFYLDQQKSVEDCNSKYNYVLHSRLDIFKDIYCITAGKSLCNWKSIVGYKYDKKYCCKNSNSWVSKL